MKHLHTDRWSLDLPPEWRASRVEEGIQIVDEDEVGVIEITTLCRAEGEFSAAEVARIAAENDASQRHLGEVQRGDFRGLGSRFQDAGSVGREWYVAAGDVLLFITYSCDVQQAGLDDAAVDQILDTLRLSSSGV